jgi:RNA polymerase sigma-70 factor (ECF subfamily)
VHDAETLMERVRGGDRVAFERLYDAYHRLVYGVALRMLGDVSSAEDVTQSVFLTLWSAPERYRTGNFAAWIARVTRNRALDLLRARASHPVDGEIPATLPEDDVLEDVAAAHLDAERVRAALARLPAEQREPIELGFFAGITHQEIAKRTGVPLGTIKTRIRAGLRKLRDALEKAVTA